MARSTSIGLAGLMMLAALAPAGADTQAATHVDSIQVSAGATALSVTGQATFVDVPVEVATDGSGDATPAMIGADLTSATISRPDPSKGELKMSMTVADAMPGVFTLPEVVHYSFFFGVGEAGADGGYLLQALRSAQVQAPGNANPFFRLMKFRAAGTCCDPVQLVPGSMANGKIEWTIPLNKIGAGDGTLITAHPAGTRQIQIQLGASGQQWLNNGQPDFMAIEVDYAVPGRVVEVGLAPAGTPPAEVPLTTAATVGSTGSFSASIPKPAPGSYVVVARACFGSGSCGISSSEVTV